MPQGFHNGWGPGHEQVFFLGGFHSRLCLRNKLEFSYRAHLIPTFTFGETEVYEQVLYDKDSWMYKFQSCFRRLFGFYCCVFYGLGFSRGSTGLLPYPLPITTVGKCWSQPKGTSALSQLPPEP